MHYTYIAIVGHTNISTSQLQNSCKTDSSYIRRDGVFLLKGGRHYTGRWWHLIPFLQAKMDLLSLLIASSSHKT